MTVTNFLVSRTVKEFWKSVNIWWSYGQQLGVLFFDSQCSSLYHVTDCESVHTRGHNLRLYKQHCNVNCRLNAFVCRNINVWNRLPAHVVNSDSVAVFKHTLACVNFSELLLLGHLLALSKRQRLCPACFCANKMMTVMMTPHWHVASATPMDRQLPTVKATLRVAR